jgi:hypothetical protein
MLLVHGAGFGCGDGVHGYHPPYCAGVIAPLPPDHQHETRAQQRAAGETPSGGRSSKQADEQPDGGGPGKSKSRRERNRRRTIPKSHKPRSRAWSLHRAEGGARS